MASSPWIPFDPIMSAHARVQHCWTKPFKRMQHVVTRFIDHENNRNVAWSCIGSLNQIKLHATSCNIVQHRATGCSNGATCCMQQCWMMLHATMLHRLNRAFTNIFVRTKVWWIRPLVCTFWILNVASVTLTAAGNGPVLKHPEWAAVVVGASQRAGLCVSLGS